MTDMRNKIWSPLDSPTNCCLKNTYQIHTVGEGQCPSHPKMFTFSVFPKEIIAVAM